MDFVDCEKAILTGHLTDEYVFFACQFEVQVVFLLVELVKVGKVPYNLLIALEELFALLGVETRRHFVHLLAYMNRVLKESLVLEMQVKLCLVEAFPEEEHISSLP